MATVRAGRADRVGNWGVNRHADEVLGPDSWRPNLTPAGWCGCTKVRVLGKQIVSLARLDCLRGAKVSGIGVFPDCFRSGVGAKGEGEETRPPLLRNRGDGETLGGQDRCLGSALLSS